LQIMVSKLAFGRKAECPSSMAAMAFGGTPIRMRPLGHGGDPSARNRTDGAAGMPGNT
jgi:hypothetical protein